SRATVPWLSAAPPATSASPERPLPWVMRRASEPSGSPVKRHVVQEAPSACESKMSAGAWKSNCAVAMAASTRSTASACSSTCWRTSSSCARSSGGAHGWTPPTRGAHGSGGAAAKAQGARSASAATTARILRGARGTGAGGAGPIRRIPGGRFLMPRGTLFASAQRAAHLGHQLARAADRAAGGLAALAARADLRAPREERLEAVVPREERVARPGLLLLQVQQQVAVAAPRGVEAVGALAVVERPPAQDRVERDLLLGDGAQRQDARHEPRLHVLGPVRPHAAQAVHVAAQVVHEDGLRRVVQVVPRREVRGAEALRPLVEVAPPQHAAVRARKVLPPRVRRDAVHGEPRRLLVGEDQVLDADLPAVGRGDLHGRGPVARDALVHRERAHADEGVVAERLVDQPQRDDAVLAPRERDRNGDVPLEGPLLAKLAPHAPLDAFLEVRGAEVLAAVARVVHGGGAAAAGGHGGPWRGIGLERFALRAP